MVTTRSGQAAWTGAMPANSAKAHSAGAMNFKIAR
jgi:hypothetical protein